MRLRSDKLLYDGKVLLILRGLGEVGADGSGECDSEVDGGKDRQVLVMLVIGPFSDWKGKI